MDYKTYEVKTKEGIRYVEAPTSTQAFAHVAKTEVRQLSGSEVLKLAREGVEFERAEIKARANKSDDPASNVEPLTTSEAA